MKILYRVKMINGDYAVCETSDGDTANIALALLPEDVDEGDFIEFCNFSYFKINSIL